MLRGPASKKRQGTKSREVRHGLSSGRYEDFMPSPLSMVTGANDVRLHTGEEDRTSAGAEVQQRTLYYDGSRGGNPCRTLPQLPRFGMSVAQEGI